MSTGHRWNYHAYMTSTNDFEYVADVPASPGEPLLRIWLAKVGGGTAGEAYDGSWYYAVTHGHMRPTSRHPGITHGDDLRTGIPKTHEETARILADVLAQDYPEGSAEHDALSLFAKGT